MEIKKGFSSFSVNDLVRAEEFYSKILGLEVTKEIEMEGLLNLKINDHNVMIYQKDDHIPATFTVLNLVVDNIDSAVDELDSKGVQFEKYDDEYLKTNERGISKGAQGPAIAWLKDPAGNFIAIMEE